MPAEAAVSNVNVVPYTPTGWVVLVLRDGRTEVAGGTREPGESVMEALRRELLEEAGAAIWLTCMDWLRRWWTVSGALILVRGGPDSPAHGCPTRRISNSQGTNSARATYLFLRAFWKRLTLLHQGLMATPVVLKVSHADVALMRHFPAASDSLTRRRSV